MPRAPSQDRRLRREPLLQAGADHVAQLEDALVLDRAIDGVALLAAGDQAGVDEDLHVLADVRLRQFEGLGQLADAQLAPRLKRLWSAIYASGLRTGKRQAALRFRRTPVVTVLRW